MGIRTSRVYVNRETQTEESNVVPHRNRTDSLCESALVESIMTSSGVDRNLMKTQIHRVVVTGGPCAGKSTFLSVVQTKLPDQAGVKVFCVPEAATLLMTGGMEFTNMHPEKLIEYQLALLRVQLALEDNFLRIAVACGSPSLILCDRGTMDGRAYVSDEQFAEIMRRGGYTISQLRDARYDAIIHLVSAAIGAETFYNHDNPVRFESVDEAKKNDEHLRRMYIGHPCLKVFDNSTNFEQKLDRCYNYLCEVIGHRAVRSQTHRYLLTETPKADDIHVPFVPVHITITILGRSTEDHVIMVMKRQQDQTKLFFHQTITKTGTENLKVIRKITAKEYAGLLQQRDPTRVDIVKSNFSFMYGEYYHELGVFETPSSRKGEAVLYVDCDRVELLAPFLKIERDVTSDASYSSFRIALER